MEDVLTLKCVVPFALMDAKISAEETISVIRVPLSLGSYIPGLYTYFFSKYQKGAFIPIQDLFSVLDSKEFWAETRPVIPIQLTNGFNTLTNINLIKAAVFLVSCKKTTQRIIDELLRAFQLADPKKIGKIALNVDFLFSSLAAANRFFPRRLIRVWVEKNLWALGSEDEIQIHEFLFLASNSYDRNTMMSCYLAKDDFKTCEKKNGLFRVKADLDISDPDERLDRILGFYHMANIKFDFDNPYRAKQTANDLNTREKTPIKKVDRIIERVFSKKAFVPNPYRKVLLNQPLTRCASRLSKIRQLSLSKLPQPSRPQSAMKSIKKSIDLSKIESVTTSATKDPYHVTTFREAIISSYRMPKKLTRASSYLNKSKASLENNV